MKTRSNKISPSAKFIHFLVYGCILDVTISISIAVSVTANYKSVIKIFCILIANVCIYVDEDEEYYLYTCILFKAYHSFYIYVCGSVHRRKY